MNARDVSVVIAVYNGERFLEACLESVRAQSTPPGEIIVVDDGSTDASARIAAGIPNVTVVRQPNAGQPAALNHGIRVARGSLLAFNDADDLWMPDKLAAQCRALAASPDVEAVFGHAEQFLEADAPPSVAAALTEERRIVPSQLPTAMCIRRAAFERIGPFDHTQRIGAVVDWFHRATLAGLTSAMLPEVLVRRRLHADNIGWQQKAHARQAYLDTVRRALARARAAGPAGGAPPSTGGP